MRDAKRRWDREDYAPVYRVKGDANSSAWCEECCKEAYENDLKYADPTERGIWEPDGFVDRNCDDVYQTLEMVHSEEICECCETPNQQHFYRNDPKQAILVLAETIREMHHPAQFVALEVARIAELVKDERR